MANFIFYRWILLLWNIFRRNKTHQCIGIEWDCAASQCFICIHIHSYKSLLLFYLKWCLTCWRVRECFMSVRPNQGGPFAFPWWFKLLGSLRRVFWPLLSWLILNNAEDRTPSCVQYPLDALGQGYHRELARTLILCQKGNKIASKLKRVLYFISSHLSHTLFTQNIPSMWVVFWSHLGILPALSQHLTSSHSQLQLSDMIRPE